MVVKEGLPDIEAVEHADGKYFGARGLGSDDRNRLALEVLAPIFDHDILRRVGADAVAGECAQPLAGIAGSRTAPDRHGQRPLFDTEEAPSETDLFGAEVEAIAVDVGGFYLGFLLLPGVAAGDIEDFPGEVVVTDSPGTHDPAVEAGRQAPLDSGIAMGEIQKQPFLPSSRLGVRLFGVGSAPQTPYHFGQLRTVDHRSTVWSRARSVMRRKGRNRMSSIRPAVRWASGYQGERAVWHLDPWCNGGPEIRCRRDLWLPQNLDHGVGERRVGEDGREAVRMEMTDDHVGSMLTRERCRRRPVDLLGIGGWRGRRRQCRGGGRRWMRPLL